jgi:putative NADPH-quinone reductase
LAWAWPLSWVHLPAMMSLFMARILEKVWECHRCAMAVCASMNRSSALHHHGRIKVS